MAEGRDPKNPQPEDAAQQPDGNEQPPFEGWRKPSADEASQRPIVPGGWRKPDGSPPEPAAAGAPAGSATGPMATAPSPSQTRPALPLPKPADGIARPTRRSEELLGDVDETIAEAGAPSDGDSPEGSA